MPMVQAHAHEILNQKEASYASDTLYSATERLMAALDRLEYNLRVRGGKQAHDAREAEQRLALFEQENKALRQERDGLSEAFSGLKREYDSLQGVATAVDRKLSDSIKRLSSVMES